MARTAPKMLLLIITNEDENREKNKNELCMRQSCQSR